MARANRERLAAGNRHKRRGPVREPYEVVLIVTEGEKTEPTYFNALRETLRLSSANVKAVPSTFGTDPVSVVRFANTQLRGDGGYDRVYCVFDRNGHSNFDTAVRQVAESDAGKEKRLVAITTTPCFEFWILLHFIFTDAPQNPAGGKSSCDRVIEVLKRNYLADYEKDLQNVCLDLILKTETAIGHANRLVRSNKDNRSSNPSTDVHTLVTFLEKLREH